MDQFSKQSSAEITVNDNPTDGQKDAGNYRKGRFTWNGLNLTVENPQNSIRAKKKWSIRMNSQYGDIKGFTGNDGDPIDYFMGYNPESNYVFIVNQVGKKGKLDEHKCMLGYPDKESATIAYNNSYERNWDGLGSIIECTVPQFKHWLNTADKSKPATKFPKEGYIDMKFVNWTKDSILPQYRDTEGNLSVVPWHKLRYDVASNDPDGLVLDSLTMNDIYSDADDVATFDALVMEFKHMQRKMNILNMAMKRASKDVEPVGDVEISKPITKMGRLHIAAIYTLSDGQTITVFFHNPDTTPKKLMPDDELISWKWLLNKRDVTVVVAPEKGKDIPPREVAKRMMKLAESNSRVFKKANAKTVARLENIANLEKSIVEKESTLNSLQKQIEVAKIEADERAEKILDAENKAKAEKAKNDLIESVVSSAKDIAAKGGHMEALNHINTTASEAGIDPQDVIKAYDKANESEATKDVNPVEEIIADEDTKSAEGESNDIDDQDTVESPATEDVTEVEEIIEEEVAESAEGESSDVKDAAPIDEEKEPVDDLKIEGIEKTDEEPNTETSATQEEEDKEAEEVVGALDVDSEDIVEPDEVKVESLADWEKYKKDNNLSPFSIKTEKNDLLDLGFYERGLMNEIIRKYKDIKSGSPSKVGLIRKASADLAEHIETNPPVQEVVKLASELIKMHSPRMTQNDRSDKEWNLATASHYIEANADNQREVEDTTFNERIESIKQLDSHQEMNKSLSTLVNEIVEAGELDEYEDKLREVQDVIIAKLREQAAKTI